MRPPSDHSRKTASAEKGIAVPRRTPEKHDGVMRPHGREHFEVGESRLCSFIRRMQAQRDCLDLAAEMIVGIPGVVLELGLGNGRTYDHLRRLLPDREIFAFDRHIAAHPSCIPDSDHVFLGDIRETLPRAVEVLGASAALIHHDMGTGDVRSNADLALVMNKYLVPLACPGAIIVANQALNAPGLRAIEPPSGMPPGRYFLYRVQPGSSATASQTH